MLLPINYLYLFVLVPYIFSSPWICSASQAAIRTPKKSKNLCYHHLFTILTPCLNFASRHGYIKNIYVKWCKIDTKTRNYMNTIYQKNWNKE